MIYLDNAATSFPKPKSVISAMTAYMTNIGASYGRGGYKSAARTIDLLFSAREKVADIIHADNPEQIVFTKNATESLNIAISGMISPGSHVIVSPYEHNSVIRPLMHKKCSVSYLPLLKNGCCDTAALEYSIKPSTALVVINHSSNVSGAVSDIYTAAKICKKHGIPFLADASQSAGVLPLDAEKLSCMIAFPGHKSMLGPQGTGVLYIPKSYSPAPYTVGGTGSNSHMLMQPDMMPDKFESGTLNMPALCGLAAACDFISAHMDEIYTYEHFLTLRLIEGLRNITGIRVLCPENTLRTSAVSFYSESVDTNVFGSILDSEYDIALRCGLHCAPLAHKCYGTFESGTLRASAGFFNKKSDIDKLLAAVNNIQKSKGR